MEFEYQRVGHDPWAEPHAHTPLIVPVAPGLTAPAPIAPQATPAPAPPVEAAPALPGGGPLVPGELPDLGPEISTWFPPRGEVPGQRTPDELPPQPEAFQQRDTLSSPTAQKAAERLAAAPLQVGTPGADDAFLQHEPGKPFWPYAQSPQDMDLQRALQAAGGGPEFPAMPAPQAPQAMPTWQDPATVESTVGPQAPDWQKGLEGSLRSIAPQGSGLADTASAIPSLIGMTPAGSIADVGQSWNRGDLAGVGMAALGALPGVGAGEKVATKGAKAAEQVLARSPFSAEAKVASRANHALWTTPEPGGGVSAGDKILYRGTEAGRTAQTGLRSSLGDIGLGTYATPQEWLAGTYGGGPKASVAEGTRMIHAYGLNRDLAPDEVARVYGGHSTVGPDSVVRITRGDGQEIYNGPWQPADIEKAFGDHPSVKVVIGDPKSIGLNQINVRDPSVLGKPPGLARKLEAPANQGANALPQATEGLGASLAPNEVAGVGRLGIGGNQPPGPRLIREGPLPNAPAEPQSLDADRISTRVPTNMVPDPANPGGPKIPNPAGHQNADLTVGHESSAMSYGSSPSKDAYSKNANMVRDMSRDAPAAAAEIERKLAAGEPLTKEDVLPLYPGLKLGRLRNPGAISEALINHIKENVLALHDAVPEEIRKQSKRWYDGANKIANRWAAEFGTSARNIAGVIAALSPQTDWFQNVSRARRLLEIDRGQADNVLSAEATQWGRNYINGKVAAARAAGNQKKLAGALELQQALNDIEGKKLKDIEDPFERALYSRFYDEVHHDKSYPILHPEGHELDAATTGANESEAMGWGSFSEISNAIRAMRANDLEDISKAMGSNHKVRNFYNNIIAPNADKGDVTIDTHAIAGGLLRPLASSHVEVEHGLGLSGSSHAGSGSKGLYGLYAEAYRRAAADRGILPREMQSITWEALRGLFTDTQKRDKPFMAAINTIWAGYQDGTHDLPTTLRLISERAGGVEVPSWFRSGPGSNVAAWNIAEPGHLPRYGLPGHGSPQGVGGGARAEPAGAVSPAAIPRAELTPEEQRRIADEVLQAKEEPK